MLRDAGLGSGVRGKGCAARAALYREALLYSHAPYTCGSGLGRVGVCEGDGVQGCVLTGRGVSFCLYCKVCSALSWPRGIAAQGA